MCTVVPEPAMRADLQQICDGEGSIRIESRRAPLSIHPRHRCPDGIVVSTKIQPDADQCRIRVIVQFRHSIRHTQTKARNTELTVRGDCRRFQPSRIQVTVQINELSYDKRRRRVKGLSEPQRALCGCQRRHRLARITTISSVTWSGSMTPIDSRYRLRDSKTGPKGIEVFETTDASSSLSANSSTVRSMPLSADWISNIVPSFCRTPGAVAHMRSSNRRPSLPPSQLRARPVRGRTVVHGRNIRRVRDDEVESTTVKRGQEISVTGVDSVTAESPVHPGAHRGTS